MGKPALGVSNLRAMGSFGNLAHRAVILDARRSEVFAAVYDSNLEGLVKSAPGNTVQVGVDVIEPLGDDVEIYLNAGTNQIIAKLDSKTQAKVGETMSVALDMEKCHLFDSETELTLI